MDTIIVKDLEKRFNGFTAVDKISFNIKEGEVFGFLGPNGAGKSTTIYMLTTLLEPSSGSAKVNGFDVVEQADNVRKSIGIVFQDPTLDIRLTAYDNLDIHGRLYGLDKEQRKKRMEEVLKLVELTDWEDKMVKTFSGGMRRRLEIARGLMHTPKIIFLDEPTLGLDPQTRRHIWSYIEKLKKAGITIMLTTHYMEEADSLCDRVAIIDHGKIKALDTPVALKSAIGGSVISIEAKDEAGLGRLVAQLKKKRLSKKFKIEGTKVSFSASKNGENLVPRIMEIALKAGINIKGVDVHMPSLEDVFIHYTGSGIREEKAADSGMVMMRRAHGF